MGTFINLSFGFFFLKFRKFTCISCAFLTRKGPLAIYFVKKSQDLRCKLLRLRGRQPKTQVTKFFFLLFLSCLPIQPSLKAATYSPVSGKWSPDKYAATLPAADHYTRGYQSLSEKEWDSALTDFMVIAYGFQDSPFYTDALYYSGICYYFMGDLDLANKQFSKYLLVSGKLKYFEKIFEFKYHIAEHLRTGKITHLFGRADFPKLFPNKKSAIPIYDEIIAALPGKEIAIQSLYRKGETLLVVKEYKESIEALQLLTRRFPTHQLAADAYLVISKIYIKQTELEPQNPDFLALAKVNLQRFHKHFPGDERRGLMEKNIADMQEMIAAGLYDTGRFYERKKKLGASKVYYQDTIRKYPETVAAEKSLHRLKEIT